MARMPKEYFEFVRLTDRLLAVPRAEIDKRVKQHREKVANNPHRRGPKRKTA